MVHIFHSHSIRTEWSESTLLLNKNLTRAHWAQAQEQGPFHEMWAVIWWDAASTTGILTLDMWRVINNPTTCSQTFYPGHFRFKGKAAGAQLKLSLLENADSWRAAGIRLWEARPDPKTAQKAGTKTFKTPNARVCSYPHSSLDELPIFCAAELNLSCRVSDVCLWRLLFHQKKWFDWHSFFNNQIAKIYTGETFHSVSHSVSFTGAVSEEAQL